MSGTAAHGWPLTTTLVAGALLTNRAGHSLIIVSSGALRWRTIGVAMSTGNTTDATPAARRARECRIHVSSHIAPGIATATGNAESRNRGL